MKTSEQIDRLITDLVLAQSEFPPIPKNRINKGFNTKYADIDSLVNTCRPVLAKRGIGISQGLSTDGDKLVVTTRLFHKSGQWIETVIAVRPDKSTNQGIGGAATYMRRYSMEAILGVSATDDDDGEEATKTTEELFIGDAEAKAALSKYLESEGLLTPQFLAEVTARFINKPKSLIKDYVKAKRIERDGK